MYRCILRVLVDILAPAGYNFSMTTLSPAVPSPTIVRRAHIPYLADDQVTRPVGVRTVEPPPDTRQALRGNLYAVVELSGENTEQEALAERLLSAIQRTYFTVKGTQSHVLREALREAKRLLDSYNQQSGAEPVRAAIVIATLLSRRVLVVSNGLGLALVTAGDKIDVYPPYTPGAPTQEAVEPEGGWEIYRQDLSESGAIFIGGRRWLESLTLRELASTVAYVTVDNYREAVAALLDLAGQPALPGVLIVATSGAAKPLGATPAGLPPALRRARFGGLPTTMNAAPPVHTLPAASAEVADPPAPAGAPAVEPEPGEVQHAAIAVEQNEETAQAGGLQATLLATSQNGIRWMRGFFASLFPDQGTAMVTLPASEGVGAGGTLTTAGMPGSVAPAPSAERRLTSQPFTLPVPAQGRRARLFILLAVLIIVLVPVVVAARQWQQGASSRADAQALLDLADARLASAQEAYDAGDKVGARTLLTEAQAHVDRARTILVGRYPRADDLAVEIQRELNEVLQIQPLYGLVQPLVRFPADAQPSRVLVVDQDIYVLDTGRQLVQHFRLDLDTNTVPDQAGDIILRLGDQVDDAEVGRMVAMTWQSPIPGIEDKPHLLILDRNNHLFQYDPRLEGVTRMQLADASAWVAPSQIVAYANPLYLLDQGTNQILRYDPANYGKAPEGWFAAQTPVNLNGVQAFAIDGDIWLLFADGQILRYQQGLQVSFALENSIPLPSEPVDMAVGGQPEAALYLADPPHPRVLVFDKKGAFLRQLQAAEGDPLRGLSGLFVDESAGLIYILTQSALYQHALPS